MSALQIEIPVYFPNVYGVPVRVEIQDANHDAIDTQWVSIGSNTTVDVDPGFYVVRAELPSGKRIQQVVQLDAAESKTVTMQTGQLSPHEFQAWAYLTNNLGRAPSNSLADDRYRGVWMRVLRRTDAGWETTPLDMQADSVWDEDGVSYDLDSFGGPQFLQVGGPAVPWKLVALPGAQNLRVLIRPASGPSDEVHPLDVTVASKNPVAESILSLLNAGATDRVEQMASAGAAEQLLYSKIADPSAAAIGGYFLLKIRDLGRLHDWTQNLANWIDWMADGAVIRAWHLLLDARARRLQDSATLREDVRALLLEAVERGVPFYTEGLRLLRDGLASLAQDASDAEVAAARKVINGYAGACDWSAPTTTFLGTSPAEPVSTPVFGKPPSLDNVAFIYAVETDELVRQGVLKSGSVLSLETKAAGTVKATVQADGKIDLGGLQYDDLKQAASSVGVENATPNQWRDESTGSDLSEGIAALRHGRMLSYVDPD